MKKFLSIIAIVVSTLPLVACSIKADKGVTEKSKQIVTWQMPNVAYFNKIVSTAAVDIKFVQGSKNAVSINGTKRLVDNISVKVDEKTKTLVVSMLSKKKFVSHKGENAEVKVSSPDLIAVDLRGAGDFDCDRSIDTDNMKVTISGAGDVDFKNLVCDNAYFTINGAGDIDVDKLTAKYTNISVNGAGDIDIDFANSGSVDCSINGAGNIELEGNVKSLKKSRNGAGSIKTNKLKVGSK